jgi:signal transduction histidine kinase
MRLPTWRRDLSIGQSAGCIHRTVRISAIVISAGNYSKAMKSLNRWRGQFNGRAEQLLIGVCVVLFVSIDILLFAIGQRSGPILGPYAALTIDLASAFSLLGALRWPRQVAACVFLITAAQSTCAVLSPLTAATAPIAVVVFALVMSLPRQEAIFWVLAFALLSSQIWEPNWVATPLGLAAAILPAAFGLVRRSRLELVQSLRQRVLAAEREQNLRTEQALLLDRQRVAAEVHDLVTHHITEMVLRAGVLEITSKEEKIRISAQRIRLAGASTLSELREVVNILRGAGDPPDPTRNRRAVPASQLSAQVEDTISVVRDAGTLVSLTLEKNRDDVDFGVARTVLRIVQEALTNARKHAVGETVSVRIVIGNPTTIRVENAGSPGAPLSGLAQTGSGVGLVGLRERVTSLGGVFLAGSRADGGFFLHASIPHRESKATP